MNTVTYRTCVRCDEQYASGTYGQHRLTHPEREHVRTHTTGPAPVPRPDLVSLYDETHSYAETARRSGLSRQRVHQILNRGY